MERRNHFDRILQLEYRANPKTANSEERTWHFKWCENGRQRTMYLGSTDDPGGKLAERLGHCRIGLFVDLRRFIRTL